jgi:hypothetical protein
MRKYTEHEDLSYASMTAGSLGLAYLELGDRDAAIHWWIDGVIRLAQDLGDEVAMTVSMRIGAIAAIERDRPEAAVMITGAHESLSRAFGVRGPIVLDRVFEAYGAMERARSVLDPITFEAALARGRQMSLGEATDLVLEMDAPQQPTTRH